MLYKSSRAAITKDHGLGAQTTELHPFRILEAGSLRSAGLVSSEASLLGLPMAAFPYIFISLRSVCVQISPYYENVVIWIRAHLMILFFT